MLKVQSFITNISFPRTMEEFLYFLEDDFHFNVDDVLEEDYLEWTAPRWCGVNDIVFFMHAKTAKSKITKLRTEYTKNKSDYTEKQQLLIEKGIKHALDNYKKYGGKIYAIGRVIKPTVYIDSWQDEVELHWKGKIYAPISDIIILDNPIDISEFRDFISISMQSAITGVFGKEFNKLKSLILSKNKTKKYFEDCTSTVLPIKDINSDNWIDISMEYRRNFFLESQFRSYYVDYLLKELTDKNVYKECIVRKKGKANCFIDNAIEINNYLLLVEIKLNIKNEKCLTKQMEKYCGYDEVIVKNKKIYKHGNYITDNAIVIDTYGIYLFNNKIKSIKKIYDLNDLRTKGNIEKIKNIIIKSIDLLYL